MAEGVRVEEEVKESMENYVNKNRSPPPSNPNYKRVSFSRKKMVQSENVKFSKTKKRKAKVKLVKMRARATSTGSSATLMRKSFFSKSVRNLKDLVVSSNSSRKGSNVRGEDSEVGSVRNQRESVRHLSTFTLDDIQIVDKEAELDVIEAPNFCPNSENYRNSFFRSMKFNFSETDINEDTAVTDSDDDETSLSSQEEKSTKIRYEVGKRKLGALARLKKGDSFSNSEVFVPESKQSQTTTTSNRNKSKSKNKVSFIEKMI